MIIGTELRFLKDEAKELGQSIGQRLNPKNYNYKFNDKVFGSNGGGFELEFKPKNVSEKGISASEYKSFRSKTPNQKIRDSVNPEGKKTNPVYGYEVEKFEADHVVSMKEITEMPGFSKLSKPKRVEVLNLEENFVGLGKRTNASKGAKDWTNWKEHKELGEVPPEVKQQMLSLEKKARNSLQKAINKRLEK